MPLTSLNIMESQIAEHKRKNSPPMDPESPVFAPKTSRLTPLNRGSTNSNSYSTTPSHFNNNSLPIGRNSNIDAMYGTYNSELSSLAKTMAGSTKLQSELSSRTNPALTKQILNLVLQSPLEFINHQRATYLVQTLATVLSPSDLCVLSEVVSQNFTAIATNKAGTHLLQLLATNTNKTVAKTMSRSLMSIKNLPKFLSDINGSYVAQVCLKEMDKETFVFLVAGILPDLASICCGAHSTFFVQKLIPLAKEKGFAGLSLVVKGVINNIRLLAFNPNGTRIV